MSGHHRLGNKLRGSLRQWLWLLVWSLSSPIHAEGGAVVAVATNFLGTAQALAQDFAAQDLGEVRFVAGASGQLYAQINQGAPFDLFLSADVTRPQRLVDDGMTVSSTVKIYCRGLLALWLPNTQSPPTLPRLAEFSGPIAIANPALAPYGAAAQSALQQAGLWPSLQSQLVLAQNVAGAHTMVASGNAKGGVVALATVLAANIDTHDYLVLAPPVAPAVEQGAVLLKRGQINQTALRFFNYLDSSRAQDIMTRHGYLVSMIGTESNRD